MRKAIIIGEEPKESKGIEFTHYLDNSGWISIFSNRPKYMKEITAFKNNGGYTLFLCVHKDGGKTVYKGHLNDGTY